MKAADKMTGEVYIGNISVADNFVTKFCGLMMRKALPDDSGLLLKGCGSVHTHFMKFTIDIIYLDKDYRVLDVETLAPWRIGKHVSNARNIIEVNAGAAAGITAGSTLIIF